MVLSCNIPPNIIDNAFCAQNGVVVFSTEGLCMVNRKLLISFEKVKLFPAFKHVHELYVCMYNNVVPLFISFSGAADSFYCQGRHHMHPECSDVHPCCSQP